MRTATLFLWLASSAFAVEITPANPVPAHSLVRVKTSGPADVFVVGIAAGQFVDVDAEACGDMLVFTGPPGSYAVLGTEGGKRFQRIVNIGGTQPPVPPTPDPPAPTPTDLLALYGIGPTAYTAAKTINKPAEAAKLSRAFKDQSVLLHESKTTPAQAEAAVRKTRESLSPQWDGWERAVEPLLQAAIDKHGAGPARMRDYFHEIGFALQAAAK